jgi:hypothetical protein
MIIIQSHMTVKSHLAWMGSGRQGVFLGDADRVYLRRCGVTATLSINADRSAHRAAKRNAGDRPPVFGPGLYAQRHTGTRDQLPRAAHPASDTRYDEPAVRYTATVRVVAVNLWVSGRRS